MKLAVIPAIASLPLLAHACADHAIYARQVSSTPSSSAAPSSGASSATGNVSSTATQISVSLISQNPTAVSLLNITASQSSSATLALSTTWQAGATPSAIPNAPPLPDSKSRFRFLFSTWYCMTLVVWGKWSVVVNTTQTDPNSPMTPRVLSSPARMLMLINRCSLQRRRGKLPGHGQDAPDRLSGGAAVDHGGHEHRRRVSPLSPSRQITPRTTPVRVGVCIRHPFPPTCPLVAIHGPLMTDSYRPRRIPNISVTTGFASCAANPDAAKDTSRCWWTCGGCTRDEDITDCPTKMNWGVTYDDGPSFYTPNLLQVCRASSPEKPDIIKLISAPSSALQYLNSQQLKTTFFTIGSRVLQFPNTAREEYMAGHQLGVHTWSHPPLTTMTNEQIIAEFGWTKKIMKDVLGVTPNTFRPPYGDIE